MSEENASDRSTWQLTLVDSGDGSGDAILPLPDDLLAQLGWHEGDVLDMSVTEDGHIRVARKSVC